MKSDIDAPGLSGVMEEVKAALDGGTTHESAGGMIKSGFKRNVSHLRVHVERAERTVAAAEKYIELFDAAVARAQSLLLDPAPGAAQAKAEKRTLPKLESPPAPRGGSSFAEFDPRGA